MNKPRVLHINTERTWRGGEQQTMYLLDGLRAAGFETALLAKEGGVIAERADKSGHRVFTMRMKGEADFRVPWRLRKIINAHSFNILHAHTSHGHVYAQLAAAWSRPRPKVIVHRRVDFSIFRRSFLGLNRWKYSLGVDQYVAVSKAIKDVLIKDGLDGSRIEVVHSGIDIARIDEADVPRDSALAASIEGSVDTREGRRLRCREAVRKELGVASDAPFLANVAFCAPHKSQITLVEAMPRILAKLPQARAAIVGDGELRSELEARAQELGLGAALIFTGFREDVPQILKSLDLFVMPSSEEGLGTSVLDAMAAELPVVGTEAGGMPEMFLGHSRGPALLQPGETGNGIVVPIRDSEALASAVVSLLSRSPQERAKVGERARRVVLDHFSTTSMVRGNVAVYERLLAGDLNRR